MQLAELEKHYEWSVAEIDRLNAELAKKGNNDLVEAQDRDIKKLSEFKSYVHQRLDDYGVPSDPKPEETKETGCRIGPRLDYLFERIGDGVIKDQQIADLAAKLEAKNSEVAALKAVSASHQDSNAKLAS